jgi:hypothetical protein
MLDMVLAYLFLIMPSAGNAQDRGEISALGTRMHRIFLLHIKVGMHPLPACGKTLGGSR